MSRTHGFAPLLRSAAPLWAALLAACGSPPPTCSATDEAYRICSDDQVWECPVATAQQLAAKQAITDACQQEANPNQCILRAKYEMFPMNLVAKCKEGGLVCKETLSAAMKTAACEMP